MTTQEAVNYFNVLIDKYGSPNVIDSEILTYLNHAINEYLNRVLPSNQGGVINFEEDKNVIANIQPLIYAVTVNMDSTGLLTDAVLNAAVDVAAGTGSTYLRIMSVGQTVAGVTYPVKYVRQNNLWPFHRNYFKKPVTTQSKFTLVAEGLQFYPTAASNALKVAVIKKPNVLALSPVVNPEWGDMEMFVIIAIALQLGGVAIRDEEVIQDLRNITLQGK